MKKGFTLIELIIVIALFSVLMLSVSWVFVAGLRTWNSGVNRAEIRQDGTLALEKMVREISQADSFTIAHADRVKFDADLDDDGGNEDITFATDDNRLIRTVSGTSTVLAYNVQSFGLLYRDLNNAVMPFPITGNNRDNIRVIIMSLTMSNADETIDLSSGAYARNQ